MNNASLASTLALLLAVSLLPACAQHSDVLRSPEPGVLCDRYVCADDQGISRDLTERHVGAAAAARLAAQGEFDPTQFTFANGIFCDVKERLCRVDRYFDAKGQRSAVSAEYTRLLFVDEGR